MLNFLKKVYDMLRNKINKIPIHGYIKTKSITIVENKSILERAILINNCRKNNHESIINKDKKVAKNSFVKK